jgi:hypothetical protein
MQHGKCYEIIYNMHDNIKSCALYNDKQSNCFSSMTGVHMLSVVEKSFLNPDWFLEIISVDKKVNLLLITYASPFILIYKEMLSFKM